MMKEKIQQVCEEIGCQLYYLKQNPTALQIFINKSHGSVGLSDCEKISRKLKDDLSDSFSLEVSSPGLERFLIEPWHFEEAVGEMIRFHTESSGSYSGYLENVNEEGITIRDKSQSLFFKFKNINKANVIFEYTKNKKSHSTT